MTEKRKQRAMVFLPVLICMIGVIGLSAFWLHEYRQAAFKHISKFSEIIIEDHPEEEELVLSKVKEYLTYPEREVFGSRFLETYGYRSNEFCEGIWRQFILLPTVLLLAVICAFFISVWCRNRHLQMRIAGLTEYLEQVNTGAGGTIMQVKEDEFSRLEDEIYKTVTTLYQTRDNAVRAKLNFADNLANIAHQLKTPITAALLSLQLMERTGPNSYGEQIKKQLERLTRLEEALLTLSGIDAGALQLEHSRVDVYTALCLAVENLDDLLRQTEVSVEVPEHGCIEICGDMEWTMEALMNLIKNCMEHSPGGGTVHCDYSQNPLYVEIRIWDEGEGFAPGDIPRLFERFYRGEGAAGDGTGLGLALARSIFELQNGSITARNRPEGGACFEVRIYSH